MSESIDASLGQGKVDRFGEIEWYGLRIPQVCMSSSDFHFDSSLGQL